MKEILDKLIDSLSNGNILLAAVIAVVALIFNYKKIMEFIDERKKARIVKLIEALECEHIQGLTKCHLEEELATEHFKMTTGIEAEKEFREAIIQAHRNTNGALNFIQFKRALPHLFYKDSNLSVRITKFEWVGYWFNLIFGFILFFSGLLYLILPSQIKDIKLTQAFSIFGLGCFFIVIAAVMIYQTFPVASAKKIWAELVKIDNNSI